MEHLIQLRVLTPEGLAFETRAVSVVARGEPGYLGILRNHAPLVTTLAPGKLTWRTPGGAAEARLLGSGLLEVEHNRVTILTDRVTAAPRSEARYGQ